MYISLTDLLTSHLYTCCVNIVLPGLSQELPMLSSNGGRENQISGEIHVHIKLTSFILTESIS